MAKTCYHCGEPLNSKDKVCPRCGAAVNKSRKPQTIYELRTYCAEKHVPLEQIRFFIGEDYREPKAFGIYQDDDGQFVVYKNKADGSRAIRYRGPDEAHAVSEIYEKLKSEVELRRAKKSGGVTRSASRKKQPGKRGVIAMALGIIVLTLGIIIGAFIGIRNTPRRGYYRYNDNYYYYYHDWYWYDDNDWYPVEDIDEQLQEEFRDYRIDGYDDSYAVPAFEDTDWYEYEDNRYDSDDDDDDWGDDDWDDWDTGDTDWDSDW